MLSFSFETPFSKTDFTSFQQVFYVLSLMGTTKDNALRSVFIFTAIFSLN